MHVDVDVECRDRQRHDARSVAAIRNIMFWCVPCWPEMMVPENLLKEASASSGSWPDCKSISR
jgi:hypothetical protein